MEQRRLEMNGSRLLLNNLTDSSNETESGIHDQDWSWMPLFFLSISIIIISFTISGNSLVIFYMRRNKEFSRNFRIYATSLAVTDLSVGAIAMPLSLLQEYQPEWFSNAVSCNFRKIVDYALVSISMFLLDAIAYDRYRCVTPPLLYRTSFTKRRSVIISISLWILGFVVWIPFTVVQQSNGEYKATSLEHCLMDFSYFSLGQAVLAFYVPIVFLVVVCILLMCALKKRISQEPKVKERRTIYHKSISQQQTSSKETAAQILSMEIWSVTTQTHPESLSREFQERQPSVESQRPTRTSLRSRDLVSTATSKIVSQNKKCFKTMSVVVFVFLICWGPYCIAWPIRGICVKCVPQLVFVITYFMAYSNSACNPCIYVLTNKPFRNEILNVMRRRMPAN